MALAGFAWTANGSCTRLSTADAFVCPPQYKLSAPLPLCPAVVSNDVRFVQHILGSTVNGTTYAGIRARTTGAYCAGHLAGCTQIAAIATCICLSFRAAAACAGPAHLLQWAPLPAGTAAEKCNLLLCSLLSASDAPLPSIAGAPQNHWCVHLRPAGAGLLAISWAPTLHCIHCDAAVFVS